jgi:hypothetical protein
MLLRFFLLGTYEEKIEHDEDEHKRKQARCETLYAALLPPWRRSHRVGLTDEERKKRHTTPPDAENCS